MSKYQGGYVGNTPVWANQNRSGVWTTSDQYYLKKQNQWPYEGGVVKIRYIMRNFITGASPNYDSGDITLTRDPDMIFWAIQGAGFASATGGSGGSAGGGNIYYSGGAGESPRGAVYLSWRRAIIIQVATVNGSGGITSFVTTQLGKGLRATNFNTNKTFTTASPGINATFNLSRDANNFTTATLVNSGSGYSVGNTLSWIDTIGEGSGDSMDPYWDILLHGVAGAGGSGAIWAVNPGQTGAGTQPLFVGSAGGSTASGSVTAGGGGGGWNQGNAGDAGPGGGGAGWGGGPTVFNPGQNGWAGYSPLNTTYVTNGTTTSTSYGSRAIELLVNGAQVKLISNAIDSYSLT